ncbi:Crp/Fnr family transcriptional regulator [Sphingobacterium faecale]|uniref:Crp/Fnr family transcriptional regulator n=1 Tax=Sphingobacterium faecale TaxID=2803775 RepID=A0ABS1R5I6_9SPHI|nr:Crp/Fnr family transcriptional regulator [Sphingobacterium faecale]MBL1409973.1 Crp/Fnr family transcriptional regulator [Sphingobacterium faecale]
MELVEAIQQIYALPMDELDRLVRITERIQLEKNNILIDKDKTAKYIYFLTEGICRIYYPKEQKEAVLDFCFPGDSILSLNSYIHGTPGYEIVDTLENCVLYRIPVSKLQRLYNQSLPIANWGRKLAELETLKIEQRLMQTLFKTAAERYGDLLTKEANVVQRIKLGYIASYLGVTQVTLSRIRAEIK